MCTQGLVGVVLGGLAYNGYSKQFVHDKEVEEAIKRSYKGEQVTILELEEAAAMWKRKEMDDLNTKLDAAHQEIERLKEQLRVQKTEKPRNES